MITNILAPVRGTPIPLNDDNTFWNYRMRNELYLLCLLI